MATPFHRTLRALEAERPNGVRVRLVVGLMILAAWAIFLRAGRIAVHASTREGRLEVSHMAHRVAAPEAGRVVWVGARLGQDVAAGDPLLRLDASVEERRLDELTAQLDAFPGQLQALERQIEAEQDARKWQAKVAAATVQRARIDLRRRRLAAARDERLRKISRALRDRQAESEVNHLMATNQAVGGRLEAAGARADLGRLQVARTHEDSRARANLAELERQVEELTAAHAAAKAAAETARAAIARLTVRAPIAGKLGHIAVLQPGDVVKAGDAVATVVPGEGLRAVALFPASEVVGRIVEGQRARIRLDGFAWTDFGTVGATVSHVGSEPAGQGTVRVELKLDAEVGRPRIRLQHGMPGSVEVEIERVSPWTLLVRTAARLGPGESAS